MNSDYTDGTKAIVMAGACLFAGFWVGGCVSKVQNKV